VPSSLRPAPPLSGKPSPLPHFLLASTHRPIPRAAFSLLAGCCVLASTAPHGRVIVSHRCPRVVILLPELRPAPSPLREPLSFPSLLLSLSLYRRPSFRASSPRATSLASLCAVHALSPVPRPCSTCNRVALPRAECSLRPHVSPHHVLRYVVPSPSRLPSPT
jgi:hypothetical protein